MLLIVPPRKLLPESTACRLHYTVFNLASGSEFCQKLNIIKQYCLAVSAF